MQDHINDMDVSLSVNIASKQPTKTNPLISQITLVGILTVTLLIVLVNLILDIISMPRTTMNSDLVQIRIKCNVSFATF